MYEKPIYYFLCFIYYMYLFCFYCTVRIVNVNASRSVYGQCKNYIQNFVHLYVVRREIMFWNFKLCALHVKLEDKFVITRARGILKNIARLRPISIHVYMECRSTIFSRIPLALVWWLCNAYKAPYIGPIVTHGKLTPLH